MVKKKENGMAFGNGPEKCDLCKGDLRSGLHYYDLRLPQGPWAWVCYECRVRLGSRVRIGVGQGQMYDSKTGVKVDG